MLSDVTDLINEIRENEWEADYARKTELAALVDDYLCCLDIAKDITLYGTEDYKAVFPDFDEEGHIKIEYENVRADFEKDGKMYLKDKNFIFRGINLVQKFNGDDGYVIEDEKGNEIAEGDLDLSRFELNNAEKYLVSNDPSVSGEKPTKKYEVILTVSGRLGFSPFSEKDLETMLKEGD